MNQCVDYLRFALVLPLLVTIGARPARIIPAGRSDRAPLVAEAPIWGANDAQKGYAFLPVTLQGHAATLMINLKCTACDIMVSTTALTRLGVTLPNPTATTLDALTIGTDLQHERPGGDQPATALGGPPDPRGRPPVVGTVGVHFLTRHYDMLVRLPLGDASGCMRSPRNRSRPTRRGSPRTSRRPIAGGRMRTHPCRGGHLHRHGHENRRPPSDRRDRNGPVPPQDERAGFQDPEPSR